MTQALTFNDGEIVAVKWTNEDLKDISGNYFPYSIRNSDILYIRGKQDGGLICELREDLFYKKEGRDFRYGLFIVPFDRLDTYENISKLRELLSNEVI